jgi:hypothetical protein
MDFNEFFYLDETSPSYLRWKVFINNRKQKDSVAGHLSAHGYWRVSLKRKVYPVHLIVYSIHYGYYDDAKTVDHLDNCPSNNNPSNLALATRSGQNKNRRLWGFKTMDNTLNLFELSKVNSSQ